MATDPRPSIDLAAPAVDTVFATLRGRGASGTVLIAHGDERRIESFREADREAGVPNGPDVLYDVGSLTKQFTAAAIVHLQMRGRLSVRSPLFDFLPELGSGTGRITLHRLLTHTAGLPPALGHDDEPLERDAFIALVASTPVEPGDAYSYSNVGYGLLAAVVETVSGEPYEEYLKTHLFEPCGMRRTGYLLPECERSEIAVGYDGGERFGRPDERPWADDGPYWHLRGNGGLMSTARDMRKWHDALSGTTVLDGVSTALLHAPHVAEEPGGRVFYGYGWAHFPTAFGTRLVAHNGGNGVFFADFLRFVDEGLTVFVASNAAGDFDDDGVAFTIADAVFGRRTLPPGM